MPSFIEILGVTADVVGVVSFLISIPTLVLASGIKRSILKYVEKNDYIRDIDNQLTELQASYEMLLEDDEKYGQNFLDLLVSKLEVFPIRYEAILSKKVIKQVNTLIKQIEEKTKTNFSNKKYKQDCARQLHQIILTLEKEKKLL